VFFDIDFETGSLVLLNSACGETPKKRKLKYEFWKHPKQSGQQKNECGWVVFGWTLYMYVACGVFV
jgi:hypothetical protein